MRCFLFEAKRKQTQEPNPRLAASATRSTFPRTPRSEILELLRREPGEMLPRVPAVLHAPGRADLPEGGAYPVADRGVSPVRLDKLQGPSDGGGPQRKTQDHDEDPATSALRSPHGLFYSSKCFRGFPTPNEEIRENTGLRKRPPFAGRPFSGASGSPHGPFGPMQSFRSL